MQLNIDIYSDGKTPLATSEKEAKKELTVQDLQPGTYYVRVFEDWRSGEETSFELTTIFKPENADQANGVFKTQAGARELPPEKGSVSDTVDYSAMRRTNWWKVSTPGQGGLQVKFDNQGNKIDAFLVDPNGGAPVPIDPTVGFKKDDLPPGDYFVNIVRCPHIIGDR